MKWTNMKNLQLGFHLSLRSGENGFRISMSDSFFLYLFFFSNGSLNIRHFLKMMFFFTS